MQHPAGLYLYPIYISGFPCSSLPFFRPRAKVSVRASVASFFLDLEPLRVLGKEIEVASKTNTKPIKYESLVLRLFSFHHDQQSPRLAAAAAAVAVFLVYCRLAKAPLLSELCEREIKRPARMSLGLI